MYKITKDKLTFILFLVGMSLSLSTILNGYQIMSNWIQKYESQDGISKYNAYINIYSTTGATEYKLNDIEEYRQIQEMAVRSTKAILERISDVSCDAVIRGDEFSIGSYEEDADEVQIAVAYHGDWNRLLESGRYPTMEEWNSDNIYLVVGHGWKNSVTVSKDGTECLSLDGIDCQVTGYLESFGNDSDKMIIAFGSIENWTSESDVFLNRIADGMTYTSSSYPGMTIQLMDKSVPVAEQADELIEIFGQSDNYYAQLLDHYESQTDVYIVYKLKAAILILLYIVGIINCIMIARVWYARQKRDFAIMKTVGITDRRIIVWQLVRIGILMGISIIVAGCLQIFYCHAMEKKMVFVWNTYILWYFIFMIGILLLVLLFPICKLLRHLVPAKEVRD